VLGMAAATPWGLLIGQPRPVSAGDACPFTAEASSPPVRCSALLVPRSAVLRPPWLDPSPLTWNEGIYDEAPLRDVRPPRSTTEGPWHAQASWAVTGAGPGAGPAGARRLRFVRSGVQAGTSRPFPSAGTCPCSAWCPSRTSDPARPDMGP
jgi:hypothetical protein